MDEITSLKEENERLSFRLGFIAINCTYFLEHGGDEESTKNTHTRSLATREELVGLIKIIRDRALGVIK